MIKIINQSLQNKDRLEKFKRSYKFLDEIKDDNPNNVSVKCRHTCKGVINDIIF